MTTDGLEAPAVEELEAPASGAVALVGVPFIEALGTPIFDFLFFEAVATVPSE